MTMEMFDLVDIQRVRHPKLRKFTYESKSLKVKYRIDFFLVAKNLTLSVKSTRIYPSIAPDHDAISISLSLPNLCPRDPGFWKFNNTLLNDEQYVSRVRDTYSQARNYYGHLTDKRLFWEMIKMDIRSATISYSKRKCKWIRDREKDILFKLDLLDRAICNNFSSHDIDETLQEYENLKSELKLIYEEKGKQAMFRAKCRWVEGNFSDEACDLFARNLEIPTLRDEERDNLEGPLTYDDCRKSLETFQNDKAPGEDGFTIEFYKCFFDLLGNDLLASFNEAHAKGQLSISQRRGIITFTPKEDGSLLDLSNWKPIRLLNVDLKIAAKAIAKHLEPILATLIHPDQTGFVKGRYIGENIRLINDEIFTSVL